MGMETHKICTCCKADKPIDQFQPRSDRLDNFRSHCRVCCGIARHKWYIEHQTHVKKLNHQRYLNNPEQYKQYSRRWRNTHPEQKLIQGAKERARKCNLPMNITAADIIIPKLCPVLGIPLKINRSKAKDNSPTLDRVNPIKGYIKGNIHVISFRANAIKNAGTIEEHKKIIQYMEQNS